MRERAAFLHIPDHLPVYSAELPGLGVVYIQPMRFAVRQDWLREMERTMARVQAAPTVDHSGLLYGLHAATVGIGWAHPAKELEADRSQHPDLASYGLAVIDELEAAGVYAPAVLALGKRVSDEQTAEMREIAGAAARVPFSRGRTVDTASSSSEPAPDTAAPRGRSKNSTPRGAKS